LVTAKMKKWVQNLFVRDKSSLTECSGSRKTGSQIDNSSTIPKNRTNAEAISKPAVQKIGAQKGSNLAAVTKTAVAAADASLQVRTVSAVETEHAVIGTVQPIPVSPTTNSSKVAEAKTAYGLHSANQNNALQSGSPAVVIKSYKDLLKEIMSCTVPTKLRLDPQRNQDVQQRVRLRKKELKLKMTASREPDDVDRLVLDAPIPVADDDPPQSDYSQLDADEVLQRHREAGGSLQMLVNNDTLYTLYASLNRLDVVKRLFRHQMNSEMGLYESVNIRTPATDGRTCLYAFAANYNLEGVRFCVLTSFPNAYEGWMTAAMAVLSASACEQLQLDCCVQFLLRVLSSLGNACSVHLNDYLNWHQLCLWLPQHVARGYTLLHFACAHCKPPLIKALLNHGANPTLLTAVATQNGRRCNAFEICSQLQSPETVSVVTQMMLEACSASGWPVQEHLA
ncbi:hypothetical protein BOX15_Mlig029539g1, partial [Macrostomum lignano]